jgi:hypothetical protein
MHPLETLRQRSLAAQATRSVSDMEMGNPDVNGTLGHP